MQEDGIGQMVLEQTISTGLQMNPMVLTTESFVLNFILGMEPGMTLTASQGEDTSAAMREASCIHDTSDNGKNNTDVHISK